jgi:hypothetical protein
MCAALSPSHCTGPFGKKRCYHFLRKGYYLSVPPDGCTRLTNKCIINHVVTTSSCTTVTSCESHPSQTGRSLSGVTSIGPEVKAIGKQRDNNHTKTKAPKAQHLTAGVSTKRHGRRQKPKSQLLRKNKGLTTCQRPEEADTKHGSNRTLLQAQQSLVPLCRMWGEAWGAPWIQAEPLRAMWRPAAAVSMRDR